MASFSQYDPDARDNGRDTVYQKTLDRVEPFAFDQRVVAVFDDMISRSVPGYQSIVRIAGTLAEHFVPDSGRVYDLGCSTGSAIARIAEVMASLERSVDIVGIDQSAPMIAKAHQRLGAVEDAGIHIELIEDDIVAAPLEPCDLIVMNFTLQFVPLDQREALIRSLYRVLRPGGALILSEKLAFDEPLGSLYIQMHHEYKRAMGYSELEIAQKRTALENVLVPETLDVHLARLNQAGFGTANVWFQCLNFASLLAIKPNESA